MTGVLNLNIVQKFINSKGRNPYILKDTKWYHMSQINLRLPKNLRREAERYTKRYGYKSVQEFAKELIREKILQEEGRKETLEIMKNKELLESIKRSIDDVKHGRVYTFKEMNELRRRYQKGRK